MATKRKLTKRQQKFVETASDPNIKSNTEAARRAGYSKHTAREAAVENLAKPHIFEAIEKRKAKLAELAQVTQLQILGATAEIAFASIEDALDDNGHLDIAKAKKNGSISLIKKITRNPNKYGETVAIEFYPKDAAQARLAEYLGMKQQDRINEADDDASRLRHLIEVRANEKGIPVEEEFKSWLEHYSTGVRPEIREKIVNEFLN